MKHMMRDNNNTTQSFQYQETLMKKQDLIWKSNPLRQPPSKDLEVESRALQTVYP